MLKTEKFIYGAVMLGTVLFSGCQNTVNTISEKETHAKPHIVNDKRFVTDSFLRDRLLLKEVNVAETNSGFMQVQVSAQNNRVGFFSELWSSMTGGAPYHVSYKFVWLNGKGMAVADGIWMTKIIKPGETVYFQSTAPSRTCKDFVLNLKEAEEE